MFARELQQGFATRFLHVRGIHNRESQVVQALGNNCVKQIERIGCGFERVLVIAHERAAKVGRHGFGRQKMTAREGGFARAARADQNNQTGFGKSDLHDGLVEFLLVVPHPNPPPQAGEGTTQAAHPASRRWKVRVER